MRIVSLQPSITLTLAALGRADTLCGITKYCVDAMPELGARGVAVLHDSWTADTVQITAARPELVIASVPYRMESLAALLKAGLPLLTLAPRTVADIFADIRLLGTLVEARREADDLVASMAEGIANTRREVEGFDRRTIYCEEWGKPLIRSQHWVAEVVDAAGGKFLGTPGGHTTAEEVAAADPDVLAFAWCGAGDRVPLARVIEQRGWSNLSAVRAGHVVCIPDEYLNTPAHTLLEGLRCLAGVLHPDMFPPHPRVRTLAR